MISAILSRTLTILASLALFGTLACSAPSHKSPAVPEGLDGSKLPDIAANGYLYVRQPGPTLIKKDIVQGINADMSVVSAQALLGATANDIAFTGGFPTGADAAKAKGILMEKQAPEEPVVTGTALALGYGNKEWASAAVAGLQGAGTIPLSEKFPGAYGLLKYFPEQGPGRPVAIVLLHVDSAYLASFQQEANLSQIRDALSRAKIDDLAAIVYVDQPLVIDEDLMKSRGQAGGGHPAIIIVGQIGYSSWLVAGLFDTIAQTVGLTEVEVQGTKVYRYDKEPSVKVLVAERANVLYIAIAADEDTVEKAILSVAK